MRTEVQHCLLKVSLLLGLMTYGTLFAQEQKEYISYQTFKAWTSLLPDRTGVRLCALTMYGHELWAKGQLRLPATTVLHGDFSGTGQVDWAIQMAAAPDDRCKYILIATQHGSHWKRLFLYNSTEEETLIWNDGSHSIGFDSGLRKEYSSPATMTWSDTGTRDSRPGYKIEKRLVFKVIRWSAAEHAYKFETYKTAQEWD